MIPEVILLDCGGTLSWPPFARAGAIGRELMGDALNEEEAYEGFYRSGHALEQYLRQHNEYPVSDNLSLNHWVYEQGHVLLGKPDLWPRRCTDELFRREKRMGKWDTTYPWVGEALARLHQAGYRLAVVSNSDGHVAELLAGLGYAKYMETIVDSYIEQISKPDPRLFYIALERMGLGEYVRQAKAAAHGAGELPPVLYVGDSFRADVLGASRAGLTPVLIDPYNLYASEDCRRVRDMAAFAASLQPAS